MIASRSLVRSTTWQVWSDVVVRFALIAEFLGPPLRRGGSHSRREAAKTIGISRDMVAMKQHRRSFDETHEPKGPR